MTDTKGEINKLIQAIMNIDKFQPQHALFCKVSSEPYSPHCFAWQR